MDIFIPGPVGYRLNDYLMVVKPPEVLWQKIMRVKEDFAERFSAPMARRLKPHLCLLRFQAYEMMEEKIIQRTRSLSMGVRPFLAELNDYGGYPSHTIHIQVSRNEGLRNLVRELKQLQRMMYQGKGSFMDDPHIAIARKLKPWQYEQGWNTYSHRQFHGKFIADHLLLLKRDQERSPWQVVNRFDFLNLPVSVKQASLFA